MPGVVGSCGRARPPLPAAWRPWSRRGRACAGPQLAPRPVAERAQLRRMPDRDLAVVSASEDMLRVAQACAREPFRAGHLPPGEHALVRLARLDLEELPDRAPEILELVDRPPPKVGITLELKAARLVEPLAVAGDRGGRDPLRARRPGDRRRHWARCYRSAARSLERRCRLAPRLRGGREGGPDCPRRAGLGLPAAHRPLGRRGP